MKDNDKLLSEARDRYDDAVEYDSHNREEMLTDLEFLSGEGQWTEEAKNARENRVMLTINRMPQFVRQVVNDLRQSKPSIKVNPVDSGADPKTAEIYTGLIRNIETQSDAQEAYTQAVENAASCGEGAFRILTEWSSEDAFAQDIKIVPIRNPFATAFDPASTRKSGADARWAFVTEQISKDDFKKRYPKAKESDFEGIDVAGWSNWYDGNLIRIAEYWYKRPKKVILALLEGGQSIDITEIEPEVVVTLPIVRTRTVEKDCVYRVILNGAEILEGPTEWPGKYIPIVRVVGEEINLGDRIIRHGVIRWARDPQRMYNYWRSAQTEAIALQPKSPYILDPRGIQKYKRFWDMSNSSNLPYLPYSYASAKDAPPPRRESPPVMSSGMANEIASAADDLKATTGIYDSALGNKSNETSGRAILARQRESDISNYTYADNLGRAIKQAALILVDLIPKIYDTARVVRILGEDDAQDMVPINQVLPNGKRINDLSVGRYDVTVSVGPSYGTKRQEAAEGMLQAIQANPQLWQVIGDLFAKNLDWPGAEEMAERLKRTMPPQLLGEQQGPPQPPPPNPEQLIKLEQEKQQTLKYKAQADGQALDNMEKQLDLAERQGEFQAAVEQAVQQALARMIAPRPMPQQIPMQQPLPM